MPTLARDGHPRRGTHSPGGTQALSSLRTSSRTLTDSGERPTVVMTPIPADESAQTVLTRAQVVVGLLLLGGLIVGLSLGGMAFARSLLLGLSVLYLVCTGFKLLLVQTSLLGDHEVRISPDALAGLSDHNLPIYTVLVPLYREADSLPRLLKALSELEYPRDRLDIKLLLEADDHETQAAVARQPLPEGFEVVVVPPGTPQGKPRACNVGLAQARGDFLVIFDAEDRPDPWQLKKVLLTFAQSSPETLCVQAKLNYYNPSQNLLTRLFTAEYSMWFDLFLPGLRRWDFPIPLGGTSNHFRLELLRQLGGWDAWNVTEDADLGLRLHKRGFRTTVVDSTTYEEATSNVRNWIRQRSRWIKGYIQTWLVHMRHPLLLWRALKPWGFVGFQLMYLGTFFTLLLNPLLWLTTLAWGLGAAASLDMLFQGPTWAASAVSFYLGNFAILYMLMIGCLRRDNGALVKYVLLSPLYWILMSIAAWKGGLQLVTRPFYWEKTIHNLCGEDGLSAWPIEPTAWVTVSSTDLPVRSPQLPVGAEEPSAPTTRSQSSPVVWFPWLLLTVLLAGLGLYRFFQQHRMDLSSMVPLSHAMLLTQSLDLAPTLSPGTWLDVPPLPTLLMSLLVWARPPVTPLIWPLLLSAAFSAGALVVLHGLLLDLKLSRGLRWGLLLAYAGHATVLSAAVSGDSSGIILLLVSVSLRCLFRLYQPDGHSPYAPTAGSGARERQGAYLGLIAALLFLTRYEFVVWGPLLSLTIFLTLAPDSPRSARRQGQSVTSFTGFAFGVGLWMMALLQHQVNPFQRLGQRESGAPLISTVTNVATGSMAGLMETPHLAQSLWLCAPGLVVLGALFMGIMKNHNGFSRALSLLLLLPSGLLGLEMLLGVQLHTESLLLVGLPLAVVVVASCLAEARMSPTRLLLPLLLLASVGSHFPGLETPEALASPEGVTRKLLASPKEQPLTDDRRLAELLESEVFAHHPQARVLGAEQAVMAVRLLGRHFDAFVTETDPSFLERVSGSPRPADFLLLTDDPDKNDSLHWALPGVLTSPRPGALPGAAPQGAPFLTLAHTLDGPQGHRAWIYRLGEPSQKSLVPLSAREAPQWIPAGAFVRTSGAQFVIAPTSPSASGQPAQASTSFRFVGANFRALQGEQERRLYRETLQAMARDGVSVGRVFAFGEGLPTASEWEKRFTLFRTGPTDFVEAAYRQLDRILALSRQLGIRLVLTLSNNWSDYGGIPAYLTWAGVPPPTGTLTQFFEEERFKVLYRAGVDRLLNRVNSVTGVPYRDDPTIFAWELMNEANGVDADARIQVETSVQLRWTQELARYIHQRDPNHLVGSGMITFQTPDDWTTLNAIPEIDYLTVHIYPQPELPSEYTWHWWGLTQLFSFLADSAAQMQKPAILQEFGFPRERGRWEGRTRAENVTRVMEAALTQGVSGAMLWTYESASDQRRDTFGIQVDRPDTDGVRQAVQGVARRLKRGELPELPLGAPADAAGPAPSASDWEMREDGQWWLVLAPQAYSSTTFRYKGTYPFSDILHVFGAGSGRFDYTFEAPPSGAVPTQIRVEARVSSEWTRAATAPDAWRSKLRVWIDKHVVGEWEVVPDDGRGRWENVVITDKRVLTRLAQGTHRLTFEVPDGDQAHGLCIYGHATAGSGVKGSDFGAIQIRYGWE